MVPIPEPVTAAVVTVAQRTFGELATRLANVVLDTAGKPLAAVYEAITTNFKPHLEATFSKCIRVKTILNREEPAQLLDLYVGLNFNCAKESYTDLDVIDEIHSRKRVVISGTGGSGKTFFMKYFWLSIFENSRGKIPVFVELRKTNELSSDNLLTYVYRSIVNTNSNVSEDAYKKAVKRGAFTFLFDGFDEVTVDRRASITKQILDLAANNPECTIVVSSRPDESLSSWESFSTFKVQPLTQQQTLALVDKIKYEEVTKKKFAERIRADLWRDHESFLSSPLLATMMLMTFDEFADIPQKVHLFYDKAFDTLFYKHDAVKELFQRKMYTGLASDEFRKFFSLFCLVSYYEDVYEFEEAEIRAFIDKGAKIENLPIDSSKFLQDLTESICIMVKDGTNYIFSHRSFQEYFAAYSIDRILQRHARRILDRMALRTSDDAIKMLFSMNQELVEREFVLPILDDVLTRVGSPRQVNFLARHFELTEVRLELLFDAGELVSWNVHSAGESEAKLNSIERLYPRAGRVNRKYGQMDAEALRLRFPKWKGRDRDARPHRRDSRVVIGSVRNGESVEIGVTATDGKHPAMTDFAWVNEMGYAQYCRDNMLGVIKIRNEVEKRHQAKKKSLDQILDL